MELSERERSLANDDILKLLLKFAVPSIVAMLVGALYNIVDQIFIGRIPNVGYLGNAATNISFPLVTICTALSLLLGVGGASNFNLKLGAGDKKIASKFVGTTITSLIFSGIVLCIIVRIYLKPLMLLFGATNEILDYAMIYTSISTWGFPFLILATGGSALVRADGSPTYSMICTLVGAIINTILDPIFIFGLNLGITGAAIATIIGQIVSGCMILIYLFKFKTVKLVFSDYIIDLKCLYKIFSIGFSAGITQMAIMLLQIVLNNSLKYYGAMSIYGSEIPLAVAGIIMKINAIVLAFSIGMAQGLQPICGYNYGAKNYDRVLKTYFYAVKIILSITIVFFIIFQIFPRQVLSIFGNGSKEYFDFGIRFLRIFLFFTFLNGIQPITTNFFSSIGKAFKGALLSLTRQVVFLIPLIVIFGRMYGIEGIVYSAPVADFIAFLCSFMLMYSEYKFMKNEMKK